MTRRRKIAIILTLAGIGAIHHPVAAKSKFWTEPMGGAFSDANHWNPSGAPQAGDVAQFDIAGAYSVTFTANRSTDQLKFGNDKVTFELNGTTYNVKSGGTGITLGLKANDIARVVFNSGTVNAGSSVVGSAAKSSGNIVVNGGRWSNAGRLDVGSAGAGGMTVLSAGAVGSNEGSVGTTAGGRGNVTISGAGSAWNISRGLAVGNANAGSGNVVIGGGVLGVGGQIDIRSGGSVSLAGGKLSAGSISCTGVLSFTYGELELTNSKLFLSSAGPLGANVALNAGQTIRAWKDVESSPQARLVLRDALFVGAKFWNQGQVRLETANTILTGYNLSNTGLIHGTGVVWTPQVGNAGRIMATGAEHLTFKGDVDNAGRMVLVAGGTLEFAQELLNTVGGNIGGWGQIVAAGGLRNQGLLSFDTGYSALHGALRNDPGGRIAVTSGSALFSGPVVQEGIFDVAVGAVATFDGDVSGTSGFGGGGTVLFQKSYSPSVPVYIAGNASFGPSSGLVMHLGPGGPDRVTVSGVLSLGHMSVVLDPGFTPPDGGQYLLLNAGYIAYNGSIDLPNPGNGLSFQLVQTPQVLVLKIIPDPATGMLVLPAIAALFLRRRRR